MAYLQDVVYGNYKGMNSSDPPGALLKGQCKDALNVEFYRTTFARKRGGASELAQTGVSFGTTIVALTKFVPDGDRTAAELFAVDDAATPVVARLAGGTSWASMTVNDAIATQEARFTGVEHNGKFFVAYDSTVNRLHVIDPSESATTIRRVGLDTPAAPTGANTGSGSYAATERHYKVAYTVQASGVTVRRSELSAALTATPSGSGSAYRVTKPATISESETHWEIYGSFDGGTYFLLGTQVVGSGDYDDSTDPEDYDGDAPPSVGTNIPPPSAKYLLADDARVIMAGAWETSAGNATTPHNARIWWTPVLGTLNVGDDERVADIEGEVAGYHSITEPVTGLGGPIDGAFLAFSWNKVWKFVATGNVSAPYQRILLGNVGCVDHKSVVVGEDELGNPAIYWWSPQRGPVRYGSQGLAYLADDILDLVETADYDSITAGYPLVQSIYYPDKRQVWFHYPVASDTYPTKRLVFHCELGQQDANRVRFGWAQHTGDSCGVLDGVMFATTPGSSMTYKEKPYVCLGSGAKILKCDTGTDDDGTNFQAYIDTEHRLPWGPGRTGGLQQEPYILAEAASVTLTLSVFRDYGVETVATPTASIAAGGSETRVRSKVEFNGAQDLEVVQFRLGDGAAASNAWNIDALVVPMAQEGRDGVGD